MDQGESFAREAAVLTYNDCLGSSGLTRDEIAAVARDAYLTGMLRRFGLDRAAAQERFGPEMRAATRP